MNYYMTSELHKLKITELHYHPLVPDSLDQRDFEFIELKNTGSALDLSGVHFTEGVTYTFPQNTVLELANSSSLHRTKCALQAGTVSRRLENTPAFWITAVNRLFCFLHNRTQ